MKSYGTHVDYHILTGDFYATVMEWNSSLTDRRGVRVKEWIEENNLRYISSTSHLYKPSLRNIALSFSNMTLISRETLHVDTSYYWPIVLSCENISFDTINIFPLTNWKAFEAIIPFFPPSRNTATDIATKVSSGSLASVPLSLRLTSHPICRTLFQSTL